MVGNRFAYMSRMGQIESSQKKFMIILFLREFLFLNYEIRLKSIFLHGKKVSKTFFMPEIG